MKNRIAGFFRGTAIGLSVAAAGVFLVGGLTAARLPGTFRATESGSFALAGNRTVTVTPQQPLRTETTSGAAGTTVTESEATLFGVIPLKEVRVERVERRTVTLCGTPFGLKLYTDGALIVGFTDVDTASGNCCPAQEAGLRIGDVIRTVNGQKVSGNQDTARLLSQSGGQPLTLAINRGSEELTLVVKPAFSQSCCGYKAGLWIKDSCAGIGTLTFMTENGRFAGLGHGITDSDTGALMPVEYGDIVPVTLVGITKGIRGVPGELKGYFSSAEKQGTLTENRMNGVYGTLSTHPGTQQAEVALRQEVHRGAAKVLTTVENGPPCWYDVEMERICYDASAETQNMVIRITDPVLLSKTGGIVQGMSGSPIVQDGRLVGAVTHVFVNDPTCGYAIFAESMLEAADAQTMQTDALAG